MWKKKTGNEPFEREELLKTADQAIIFPILFLVSPMASRDFTSRSMETDGSPFSILAIRDWLDFNFLAS